MAQYDEVMAWVNNFYKIPNRILQEAYRYKIDNLIELTKPLPGDVVFIYGLCRKGIVIDANYDSEEAGVKLFYKDDIMNISFDDIRVLYDNVWPSEQCMYSFSNDADKIWAEQNLYFMSQLGFRIYKDLEDYALYFGFRDDKDTNTYERYWRPLYKARKHDMLQKEMAMTY